MSAYARLLRLVTACAFIVVSLRAQTPTLPLSIPAGGAVSAGGDSVIALPYSGNARAWGLNEFSKLGVRNSAALLLSPVRIKNTASTAVALTNIAVVSAGTDHSITINTSGVLRAAGRNDSGQLGDGTTANRGGYATISGISGAVHASAGRAHSLAVKSDGTVWAWGNNAFGQVGNGSTANRLTPQQVSPATPVFPQTFKAVAAGADHSLALRNDGTVWAWGANVHGQLGTGNTTASLTPTQVQNLPAGLTVTAIAAGDGFSVALLSDGTVRAWGRADQGQLGNDDNAASLVPVQPLGLGADISAVSAGDVHVLALKSDGTVWAWGSNLSGELGGVIPAAQFVPQPVAGLANVTGLDAGVSHSVAVLGDGSILAWGNPNGGALGPVSVGYEAVRVQIRDVKTAAAIYAGGDQAAVVRTNKRAYLFGQNADGQLGLGDLDPVVAPRRAVSWPAGFSTDAPRFAFGAQHTLGLADGMVYAAGDNTYGQLGDASSASRSDPVAISISGGTVTRVAAGWYHSLALRADGTVLAWGRNDDGQLGLGAPSATPTPTPTPVPGLSGVVAIAAGEAHSLALKSDGSVWAWGANGYGQLSNNSTAPLSTPAQVSGIAQIVAIAAGANHSLALTSPTHTTTSLRNRSYAWGRGTYGQIGHNAATNRLTPYLLPSTNIVGIAAGENHTLGLLGDGRVIATGRNDRGQLGDTTVANRDQAIVVNSIPTTSACTAIAAGFNTSYAIFGNGTLFGWGDASHHQLGFAPSRFAPIIWRLTDLGTDSDDDGMLNAWEVFYFPGAGGASNVSPTGDSDGDGLLQIQEHYYGSPPSNQPAGTVGADNDGDLLNDFADSDRDSPYNGDSYRLRVLSGDNQSVLAGADALRAIRVSVRPAAGPVHVTAPDASMRVAGSSSALATATSTWTVPLSSGSHAEFDIYFRQSTQMGLRPIRVGAGVDWIDIHTTSVSAQDLVDSDSDGLSDSAEASQGTTTGLADSDGDGVKDGWDAAPLTPSVSAPPYDGLLTLEVLNPAGVSALP